MNVVFEGGDYRNGVKLYADGTIAVSDSDGHYQCDYQLSAEDKLGLIRALLNGE